MRPVTFEGGLHLNAQNFHFPHPNWPVTKRRPSACNLRVSFERLQIIDMWVFRVLVRLALTGTPRTSWYVTCYPWPTMPKSKSDPWHFARPELAEKYLRTFQIG